MPTVYFLAQNDREPEAMAALLAREGFVLQVLSDLSAFPDQRQIDDAGCIVLELPRSGATLDALQQLRHALPGPLPVIVVSSGAGVSLAVQAMKEGAADVLERPIEEARLVASVRGALETSAARVDRARRKGELIARFGTLSPRERDVLHGVLCGLGNREVASQLGIKPRTVETHRSRAMGKLGARTLADLARIWLDVGAGPAT